VVDYLQLMSGQGETRNAVVEGISRGLKALAKELRIPVIALSQLSRKGDDRADRRPILSDLRDSGAIEQDADVVLFVHREIQARSNAYEWKGLGEILVRKHRQGATGDVHLTFMDSMVRFENFAGEWPAESGTVRPIRRRAFGDD
jgi:replicative DNA helicase